MSKILYRAKRKDNSEWIEGYYVKAKHYLTEEDVHVIFPDDEVDLFPHGEFSHFEEIIPETLCRLLEEPCWNGGNRAEQRFFQNDIIAVWRDRRANTEKDPPDVYTLVIDEHSISENGSGRWFPQDTTCVRIVGNVYDNPELLGWKDKRLFISRFGECPEDYIEQHRYLTNKYGIHGAQAGCYICNFENEYLCHQFNGGCERFEECRRIRAEETHTGDE